MLVRRGSKSVHSIELYQREYLSVLSCVNADGGHIPNFYIPIFVRTTLLTMRRGL